MYNTYPPAVIMYIYPLTITSIMILYYIRKIILIIITYTHTHTTYNYC